MGRGSCRTRRVGSPDWGRDGERCKVGEDRGRAPGAWCGSHAVGSTSERDPAGSYSCVNLWGAGPRLGQWGWYALRLLSQEAPGLARVRCWGEDWGRRLGSGHGWVCDPGCSRQKRKCRTT